MENRTREVEKKLKDAEKLLKEQKLKAYINPELAAVEKEKGNALVKEGKYVEAKVCRPAVRPGASPPAFPHPPSLARSHQSCRYRALEGAQRQRLAARSAAAWLLGCWTAGLLGCLAAWLLGCLAGARGLG